MLDGLKKRGGKFRSLKEAIDKDTPTGRAMWQMIGILAQRFEHLALHGAEHQGQDFSAQRRKLEGVGGS